jgi:hypothetical protein
MHRRPDRLGKTMAQRVLAALALRGGAHLLLVQLQLEVLDTAP